MRCYIEYNGEKVYYDQETRSAQFIMLELLTNIHNVCVANNLRYWLTAGTLLGCIRHQGFIPWDDDCDIVMPLEDYQKFLSEGQKILPTQIFMQTSATDKEYPKNILKLRMLGTKIVEIGENEQEPYNQGIFIDIFPCYYYSSQTLVKWMRWSLVFRNKKNKYKRGSFIRLLVLIYTNVLLYIPVKISALIRKLLEKHAAKLFCDKTAPYIAHNFNGPNKQEDIFPLQMGTFEGHEFYIPNNSVGYLCGMYGKTWDKLPPPEQRKRHAAKIYLHY